MSPPEPDPPVPQEGGGVPLLPPNLHYSPGLVLLLSEADVALARCAATMAEGPMGRLLTSPLLWREAMAAITAPGSSLLLAEVFLYELRPRRTSPAGFNVRQAAGYARAARVGARRMHRLGVGLSLLRELHGLMLGQGRPARPSPLRPAGVAPLPNTQDSATTTFSPEEDRRYWAAYEALARRQDLMPTLVQAAILHAAILCRQPFPVENRRLAGLLIPLFLILRGRLPAPGWSLASYLSAHEAEHAGLLATVSASGTYEAYLEFFLQGVIEESQRLVVRITALTQHRRRLRSRLPRRAQGLLDHLFQNPCITITSAARRLHVSIPTARQAVERLQKAGILREITGARWGRIFQAPAILKALESP